MDPSVKVLLISCIVILLVAGYLYNMINNVNTTLTNSTNSITKSQTDLKEDLTQLKTLTNTNSSNLSNIRQNQNSIQQRMNNIVIKTEYKVDFTLDKSDTDQLPSSSIISASIKPSSATSKIKVTFQSTLYNQSRGGHILIYTLFSNLNNKLKTADVFNVETNSGYDFSMPVYMMVIDTPNTTNLVTYTVSITSVFYQKTLGSNSQIYMTLEEL